MKQLIKKQVKYMFVIAAMALMLSGCSSGGAEKLPDQTEEEETVDATAEQEEDESSDSVVQQVLDYLIDELKRKARYF